jgi:transcriptional regulator with XRE-family HTH domain
MDAYLTRNLGTLCSYYPSIAEVCRKLSINRQQFNKYLCGQSRPSRHNMRRICDFFGVTESEILLEPERFEEIVGLRRRPVKDDRLGLAVRHLEKLYSASGNLERYVGYYFRYFYSFGFAGRVIKSLCVIHERDGRYFWKNIERIRPPDSGNRTTVNKYVGTVFLIADRIFIIEYETLLTNWITQVALYPSYRSRVDRLVGIQTGGPVRRGRKPGASRVLLEYLGRDVDIRKALRQSGLFNDDDPRLPAGTRAMIRNEILPGTFVLEVDEP